MHNSTWAQFDTPKHDAKQDFLGIVEQIFAEIRQNSGNFAPPRR